MADRNEDPTTATPVDPTQPLPVNQERTPSPGRPSGWRPGQVVVVGVLALLLGGAGATLAWFAADADDPDPVDVAAESTTTSTASDDDGDATSSTTSGPSYENSDRGRREGSQSEGNQDEGNRSEDDQRQGRTSVGNSTYTAAYQSNEDRSSEPFEIDDDWKIRWDVPEGAVTIEVFDTSQAGDEATPVETIEARGQGQFEVAEGGTYRIEISTDGSRYTVVVTDGP